MIAVVLSIELFQFELHESLLWSFFITSKCAENIGNFVWLMQERDFHFIDKNGREDCLRVVTVVVRVHHRILLVLFYFNLIIALISLIAHSAINLWLELGCMAKSAQIKYQKLKSPSTMAAVRFRNKPMLGVYFSAVFFFWLSQWYNLNNKNNILIFFYAVDFMCTHQMRNKNIHERIINHK